MVQVDLPGTAMETDIEYQNEFLGGRKMWNRRFRIYGGGGGVGVCVCVCVCGVLK